MERGRVAVRATSYRSVTTENLHLRHPFDATRGLACRQLERVGDGPEQEERAPRANLDGMGVDREIRLLQDRVLVDGARRGGADAFEELYRRHAGAAWRLALAVTPHQDVAGEALVHAFALTLAGPGAPPTLAGGMRVPLLAATRNAAADGGDRKPAAAPGGPEPRAMASFRSLPERSRSAYWLVDVEGVSPGEAAQVLGLGAEAGEPLADRARKALREQVVRSDLRDAPLDCRRTAERLVAYAAGELVARDEARVRQHLDECPDCQDRLAVLDDLAVRLRRVVAPLPASLAGQATRRWQATLPRDVGPLRLRLPGGAPVPAWMERSAAAVLAGAIALGVTGAILAGGRNRSRSDDLVRDAQSALGVDDGESAMGDGLSDLVLDGNGFVPPAAGAAAGATGAKAPAAASGSGDALARGGSALPRQSGTGTTDTTGPGSGTGDDDPFTPTDPGDPPPPPPPPPDPEDDSAAQLTVVVGDTVVVGVGEECTGAVVAGTPLGDCEPSTTSESPLAIDADGGSLGSLTLP